MSTKDRSLAGAATVRNREKRSSGLAFPAELIHPPQSQLAHYEDAVSSRVVNLDLWAQHLGQAFGISFTAFSLNPVAVLDDTSALAAVAGVLAAFAHRDERVSLERRSGRWGLYFTREPSALTQERRAETVPLKDAALDVRERFLLKSEEFFRGYMNLCSDRLGRMHGAVAQADRTLELLTGLHLERESEIRP